MSTEETVPAYLERYADELEEIADRIWFDDDASMDGDASAAVFAIGGVAKAMRAAASAKRSGEHGTLDEWWYSMAGPSK